MIQHAFGLMLKPRSEWEKIAPRAEKPMNIVYSLLLALLPCIAWYYGTTQVGWRVGDGEIILMTTDSASKIIVLFYLAMICSVSIIGYFIHWMSATYGASSTLVKGISVAGYCATPLYFAGLLGFQPHFMADLLIGLAAMAMSLYLLYTGIPIVMNVPKERGFLFASAIVGVCLVIFMALMGATVILWDIGFSPEFTN